MGALFAFFAGQYWSPICRPLPLTGTLDFFGLIYLLIIKLFACVYSPLLLHGTRVEVITVLVCVVELLLESCFAEDVEQCGMTTHLDRI